MLTMSDMLVDTNKSADISSVSSKTFYELTEEQKNWLMAAVMTDQMQITKLLSKNNELVDFQNYIDGNVALHYAAKFGQCALIRLLVGDNDADVNKRNFAGLTPLHMAARCAQKEAIFLLTSAYDADLSIRDHSGRLPSAYLPPHVTDQEIKKFLKCSDNLLLSAKQMDALSSLCSRRAKRNVHRSQSPFASRNHSEPTTRSNRHSLKSSQFPWQSGGSRDSTTSLRRVDTGTKSKIRSASKSQMNVRDVERSDGRESRRPEAYNVYKTNQDRGDSGTELFEQINAFIRKKHGKYQNEDNRMAKQDSVDSRSNSISSINSASVQSRRYADPKPRRPQLPMK